jgi:hypothetical protein
MTVFVMYMNIPVYHYYSMDDVEQSLWQYLWCTWTLQSRMSLLQHVSCRHKYCHNGLFDIIHAVIMIDCNVHVHHKYCHNDLFDIIHAVIMTFSTVMFITACRVSNSSLWQYLWCTWTLQSIIIIGCMMSNRSLWQYLWCTWTLKSIIITACHHTCCNNDRL